MRIPGIRTQRQLAVPFFPLVGLACLLGLFVLGIGSRLAAEDSPQIEIPSSTWFYSTAPPPPTYAGPVPIALAFDENEVETEAEAEPLPVEPADEASEPDPTPSEAEAEAMDDDPFEGESEELAPRLAAASPDRVPAHAMPEPERAEPIAETPDAEELIQRDPIRMALALMQQSHARFATVRDYTCVFVKRERVKGRLQSAQVMAMKARTQPRSVYLKFLRPNAGREAIYVHGRNQGKALVHDVGIGKILAGTLALDPRSARAMEGNRHPITEAGLGNLIDTLIKHWKVELIPGFTQVVLKENEQ